MGYRKLSKIVTIIIAILIAVTCVSFSGCKNEEKQQDISLTFEQAFDNSVLGGTGLLSKKDPITIISELNVENSDENVDDRKNNGENIKISEKIKDEILYNVKIVEATISGGYVKGQKTPSENTDEFDYTYIISAPDVMGENVNYMFNIKEIDIKREKSAENTENQRDFSGKVMVIGGAYNGFEYVVSGKHEKDSGKKEFQFSVSLDSENYVIISQKSEENKQKFSYVYTENGVEKFHTEVEYELNKHGEINMVFTTKDEENKTLEYEYDYVNSSEENYIKADIKINDDRGFVKIFMKKQPDGSYKYSIKERENNDGIEANA